MKLQELIKSISTLIYLYNIESDKESFLCTRTCAKLEAYRECLALFGYIFCYYHIRDMWYNNINAFSICHKGEPVVDLTNLTTSEVEQLMQKGAAELRN